jgi:hypothetical protein
MSLSNSCKILSARFWLSCTILVLRNFSIVVFYWLCRFVIIQEALCSIFRTIFSILNDMEDQS